MQLEEEKKEIEEEEDCRKKKKKGHHEMSKKMKRRRRFLKKYLRVCQKRKSSLAPCTRREEQKTLKNEPRYCQKII